MVQKEALDVAYGEALGVPLMGSPRPPRPHCLPPVSHDPPYCSPSYGWAV